MSRSEQHHQEQHYQERLSAFIDAEQSDSETAQIIDSLLNDPSYKEQYIRLHLMNEYVQNQVQPVILNADLRGNISHALDDLPSHYVDEAVSLQVLKTEDINQTGWFRQLFQNRVLSGVSIAASVMFVTLFTLQARVTDNSMTDHALADNNQNHSSLNSPAVIAPTTPPSFRTTAELPVAYVASGQSASDASVAQSSKSVRQYQWIEADPVLSQQVRRYVNEHESHRTAYDLQPQIRTATYQFSE